MASELRAASSVGFASRLALHAAMPEDQAQEATTDVVMHVLFARAGAGAGAGAGRLPRPTAARPIGGGGGPLTTGPLQLSCLLHDRTSNLSEVCVFFFLTISEVCVVFVALSCMDRPAGPGP